MRMSGKKLVSALGCPAAPCACAAAVEISQSISDGLPKKTSRGGGGEHRTVSGPKMSGALYTGAARVLAARDGGGPSEAAPSCALGFRASMRWYASEPACPLRQRVFPPKRATLEIPKQPHLLHAHRRNPGHPFAYLAQRLLCLVRDGIGRLETSAYSGRRGARQAGCEIGARADRRSDDALIVHPDRHYADQHSDRRLFRRGVRRTLGGYVDRARDQHGL